MKWRPWLAAPIALALGGCDFAPRYAPPSVSLPSKFKDETAGGAELPASGEWWLAFNDRTLNDLQAQVDAANPDLAAAVAANDAAVARADAALSSAYPQVDAVPHFLSNKQSANRPLRSANQPTYFGDNLIGAQTAYEVDIRGRVRDLVASANATEHWTLDRLSLVRRRPAPGGARNRQGAIHPGGGELSFDSFARAQGGPGRVVVLAVVAEEYDQTRTAATAARKAADLSLTLYRDGASSYLDVVTAQSAALDAERLAIALHTRQLAASIGLMLALGGGWSAPPEPRAKEGLTPYLAE